MLNLITPDGWEPFLLLCSHQYSFCTSIDPLERDAASSFSTSVLKEMNSYAWVLPRAPLHQVSYFPTANMFDFNERAKQPTLIFLRKIVDPMSLLTAVPTQLTNI